MSDIVERLRSWAQNEEMIDQHYLQHGQDCMDAADEIERLRAALRKIANETEGPYSLDPVKYRDNVIAWCQDTARRALDPEATDDE